jgi:hypothetical protein
MWAQFLWVRREKGVTTKSQPVQERKQKSLPSIVDGLGVIFMLLPGRATESSYILTYKCSKF